MVAGTDGRDEFLRHIAPVREAWNSADQDYAKVAEATEGLVVFDVDIDEARAYGHLADSPLDLSKSPDIAAIMSGIDGEMLDAIGHLWFRGKGLMDPEQKALASTNIAPEWKRGDLLAWDEACGVRRDLYAQDDNLFEAVDYYCPIPGCDCGEIDVVFSGFHKDEIFPIGYVSVNLSGRVTPAPEEGEENRLENLWAAYTARHRRYIKCFSRRSAVLKAIGARLVAPRVTGSKVGRNDPCPCGSEKKYKKCCAN